MRSYGLGLLVLVLAMPTLGGELKPCDFESSIPFSRKVMSFRQMKPSITAKGTVSSRAFVKTAHGISIVIDACERGGELDLIRVDFSGKEDFTDATEIRMPDAWFSEDKTRSVRGLPRRVMELDINGTQGIYEVSAHLNNYKQNHHLSFVMLQQRETECTFGDAKFPVRVCFRNLNPQVENGVMVDTGRNGFDKDVLVGEPGQPLYVNGAFYRIVVKDNVATAEKLNLPKAEIRVSADKWTMRGGTGNRRDNQVLVMGGRDPVALPAGQYHISHIQIHGEGKSSMYAHRKKPLVLKADETTDMEVGKDLRATLTPQVMLGKVNFKFTLKDSAGNEFYEFRHVRGHRLAAPRIQVVTPQGKLALFDRMGYG